MKKKSRHIYGILSKIFLLVALLALIMIPTTINEGLVINSPRFLLIQLVVTMVLLSVTAMIEEDKINLEYEKREYKNVLGKDYTEDEEKKYRNLRIKAIMGQIGCLLTISIFEMLLLYPVIKSIEPMWTIIVFVLCVVMFIAVNSGILKILAIIVEKCLVRVRPKRM